MIIRKLIRLVPALTGFLFLNTLPAFAQIKFITDSLDKYIDREMQRWNIPGVAVSVIKDGKIIYMKGFGVREAGKPGNVDENTLFMIASNTKAYTATAICLLDYEKRLSLNDKITKWMPDFKLYDDLATREVTIRDMLCHRIGFQTFQSDFLNWGCNLTRKEVITNMRTVKPVFSFRSRYGYCNACFVTAGEIIPLATDTSWDDFLKHAIFQPLKMNRTTTQQSGIVKDNNAAKPYTIFDGKLTKLSYDSIDNLGPCGSINSCVKDISNWIVMQLDSGRFEGKQIIPFEVLKKTRTSNTIINDPNNPMFKSKHFHTYGLGWFLDDYEGRKIISHDGGADGFVTNTTFIPEENFGFTILTNTDANSFFIALRDQLIDAALNVPYRNYSQIYFSENEKNVSEQDAAIKALWEKAAKNPKPGLDLKNYTGKYSNEVYGEIEIKSELKNLRIYFSHHPNLRGHLFPLGENNFVCNYDPVSYGVKETTFKVKDGKVESVTLRVNDFIDFMPYTFKKM
ncbi:MAG TPA: serine hydrolase [Bacteroidia bacterium]|nr:serine hydrolase [Bacteroidia bacterium]